MAKDKNEPMSVVAKAMVEKIYNDGYNAGFKHGVYCVWLGYAIYKVGGAVLRAYRHDHLEDQTEERLVTD